MDDYSFPIALGIMAIIQIVVLQFYEVWLWVKAKSHFGNHDESIKNECPWRVSLEEACSIILTCLLLFVIGVPVTIYISENTNYITVFGEQGKLVVKLFCMVSLFLIFTMLSRMLSEPFLYFLDGVIEHFHKPSISEADHEETQRDGYRFDEISQNKTEQGDSTNNEK